MLHILLNKIPEAGRESHRSSVVMNNLLSISILVDVGGEVFLYGTILDISYNGEVVIRGWQDKSICLWSMSLLPDGFNNSIPPNSNMPTFLTNIIFERDSLDQLIQYYHATRGNPVIFTWYKYIDDCYFQGWPSLTSAILCRHIKVTSET